MKFDKICIKILNEQSDTFIPTNANIYDDVEKFAIIFWGRTGYMTDGLLQSIPNEQSNLSNLRSQMKKYVKLNNVDKHSDEMEDLHDWFTSGARISVFGGKSKPQFSKNMLYKILDGAQLTLDGTLTVYKFFQNKSKYNSLEKAKNALSKEPNRYGSWTMQNLDFYFADEANIEAKVKVDLAKDTQLIFSCGLADDDEVIIKASEILKNMDGN